MSGRITLRGLQRMKDEGRKIVGVVAWDHQIAPVSYTHLTLPTT